MHFISFILPMPLKPITDKQDFRARPNSGRLNSHFSGDSASSVPKNIKRESSREKLVQYLVVPVLALVFYLVLIFLYRRVLGLPGPEEIIAWAQKYYALYGYWVVLVGAAVEGALFINWYLPGSIVVALGIIFARQADLNVFLMLALIIIGFFLTAILNFFLGRFGWYNVFMKLGLKAPLERVKSKIKSKGLKLLLSTYIHPNFGALAATSAGILGLPFWRFMLLSVLSIAFWNSLWAAAFYWFGPFLLRHINFLIVIAGLFVYLVMVKSLKQSQSESRLNVP